MRSGNLNREIPATLPEEWVSELVRSGPVRIERIVSKGQSSDEGFWYDQDENEFVLLVSGEALLEVEHVGTRRLTPGDWLEIPAHVRHRVAWTDPDAVTLWLAVFFPES